MVLRSEPLTWIRSASSIYVGLSLTVDLVCSNKFGLTLKEFNKSLAGSRLKFRLSFSKIFVSFFWKHTLKVPTFWTESELSKLMNSSVKKGHVQVKRLVGPFIYKMLMIWRALKHFCANELDGTYEDRPPLDISKWGYLTILLINVERQLEDIHSAVNIQRTQSKRRNSCDIISIISNPCSNSEYLNFY